EYQVKHIAIQLVQAVAMLEACAISHRDIKLSNITFPMKINEELASSSRQAGGKHQPMQIKLADFGMAGFVEKDGFLRGRCGTPGYVGVCLYTLLCGYEPFAGDSLEEIIAANKLSVYDCDTAEWEKVSDDAKDFVQRAMSATSKNRLTVLEALAHPWMAQYGGTINYPPKFKHTKNSKACVVS
ncbi:CPK1, partial [Symbiodinium microadriaticum]